MKMLKKEDICITRPVRIDETPTIDNSDFRQKAVKPNYQHQMPNWLGILKIIENNDIYDRFQNRIHDDLMHKSLYRL